jgi:predicted membrane-bound spermidine synthase
MSAKGCTLLAFAAGWILQISSPTGQDQLTMIQVLYFLFVLSGAAGLIYESIWTRYLGLFVGHDAYAQIIVLTIFLGGMSAGAMVVSRWSTRLKAPLYGYVAVEFVVGAIGLVFHDVFGATTSWAYQAIYPSLAGSLGLTVAKWLIAGTLILPQSILLGTTFPLMSAGVLRLQRGSPGRKLSMLYFSNSLGAAVGVLVAGFYLVELAGLPGTLLAAAMLNLAIAAATMCLIVWGRSRAPEAVPSRAASPAMAKPAADQPNLKLERLLLFTSLGTAVASFIYEIDWIRMLALVLGSATHSFELMLSAFILGLAFGAWWIRKRADRLKNPVRTLGLVQWTMGLLALATLPLYVYSFEWIGALVFTFTRSDAGYNGFNIARYALCLVIMFPATFCAGMTLPLITRTLMVNGSGERAVGAVYAWNTLGSIIGVVLGGLVLLPLVGLKPMLMVGAALDMGIGLLLLTRSTPRARYSKRLALATAFGSIAILAFVGTGIRLDEHLLASGVYRSGVIMKPELRDFEFYRDGRTSTVTVSRVKSTGKLSLATNGKTDASLTPAWFESCDVQKPLVPLQNDAATQALVPLVTLAHMPQARTAAMIGQGSGMSSHLLLSSPHLKELVTIEIEPQMIAGSRKFYPANRRVFDDPRSKVVIDDAKSHFASEQRRYDVIISEPSNPWVSGVSGLFTTEFYGRVKRYLTEDGVFGQWLQAYELDDQLIISVLAGLHQNFRSYEIYLAPTTDLLVVASNRATLPKPDWSVFGTPMLQKDLCRFIPITPAALDALHLVGRNELEPLLAPLGQPNSDYYPVLDLGAERKRFRHDAAVGFRGLSAEWFNLLASLDGRRLGPGGDHQLTFPENPRALARATGALMRANIRMDSVNDQLAPYVQQAIFQWQSWQGLAASSQAPSDWEMWLDQAKRVDYFRNSGLAGTVDEQFYGSMYRVLDRHRAPAQVRDVVQFRHGIAGWNFAQAAEAGARLMPRASDPRPLILGDELRDGLVLARLHLRDVAGARQALDSLARFSRRSPTDLRSQLLRSYVTAAEKVQPVAMGN